MLYLRSDLSHGFALSLCLIVTFGAACQASRAVFRRIWKDLGHFRNSRSSMKSKRSLLFARWFFLRRKSVLGDSVCRSFQSLWRMACTPMRHPSRKQFKHFQVCFVCEELKLQNVAANMKTTERDDLKNGKSEA